MPASVEEIRWLAAKMEGLPEAPEWTKAHWLAYQGDSFDGLQGAAIWLLRNGDEVNAWLAGSWVHQVAELEYLFVFPAKRHRGQARVLLGDWFAWLKARAICEVQLEVRAGNVAARRLYAATGFREQGRRPGYYRQPVEDAILMQRSDSPHAISEV